MSSRGWLTWFLLSFGSFLFFEVRALVRHRPDLTLSDAVWRFERFRTGQPIYQWSAPHFLLAVVFTGGFVWLAAHFELGWWK